jgi:hypothetical protein
MIKSLPTVAKVLPHEDIRVGDFVSVIGIAHQIPSFFWCGVDSTVLRPDQLVKLEFWVSDVVPVRVKSICLPQVFVMDLDREFALIDVRRSRLVKVDDDFAKTVWRSLRRAKARAAKKG